MVLHETAPVKSAAGSKRLVVLMHGWWCKNPSFSIRDVEDAVRDELPGADLMVPNFSSGVFSSTDLNDVCKELADAIEAAVEARERQGGRYHEIILIGFSLGSLIVRMTFLVGRGDLIAQLRGGVTKRYDWVDRVSRIILLAGNNRGWSVDPWPKKFLWSFYFLYLIVSRMRVFGLGKLIFSYQRGQPFVENLRMQWLYSERKSPIPPTIQLFGEEEDLVSRDDMVDQQYCSNFILIDVPGTGHTNAANFREPVNGLRRREKFVQALRTPIDELRQQSKFIRRRKGREEELLGARGQSAAGKITDDEVTDVVFVVHGIRDYGDWMHGVRTCLDQIAGEHNLCVAAITAAYDRFSMFDFLWGRARRRNVAWFVNEYTTALSRHPDARFHFIGHSNGTYLLANALERYAMMRFDRVVFAGSVVRRNFPWDDFRDQHRVASLLNVRAADDWVVAIFPRFLELVREVTGIPLSDIGGGGVFGFQDDFGQQHQEIIRGSHGAGILPATHASLVRYVLNIDPEPRLDGVERAKGVSTWIHLLATFSWVVWLAIVCCLCLMALTPSFLFCDPPEGWSLTAIRSCLWKVALTLSLGVAWCWWLLKTL